MDPIADMFSQIKNAHGARHESLTISYSKVKLAILEVLKIRRYIVDYRVVEKKQNVSDNDNSVKENATKKQATLEWKRIEIDLSENAIDIRRVSRPGRRVYTTSVNIPRPKRPRAMVIISTSKGVLDGEEARKKGLGGELVAEVR
ncbi:MAG: 30S ribosomal protein S8 [Patescibacteria group bacterium]|jgi:small subunit ribosomal protein S8